MAPTVTLIHGDSLELLTAEGGLRYPDGRLIKGESVVTDPPYELGFMGRAWDSTGIAYDKRLWRGLIDALRLGAHLLAFSGSRTSHRMTCAIEDAGWEIRDVLMWLYGQGFPKSLDISKAIDKKQGKARQAIGVCTPAAPNDNILGTYGTKILSSVPNTAAAQWAGWGTALKPAYEPITLARAPFAQMKVDDTAIVKNVLTRGTGAINIAGCRLAARGEAQTQGESDVNIVAAREGGKTYEADLGRWPANILFDDEAAAALDEQTGTLAASRFFYVAKPSRKERDYGCEDLPLKTAGELTHRKEGAAGTRNPRAGAGRETGGIGALRDGGRGTGGRNFHPT